MSLLRTKPVEKAIADTDEPEHRLKKNLGALDLTVFGVGVTIGGGLFVLTGVAAADYAGPAVALSFVIAAVVCGLAALCYAEFASTVPVAGSAYTFSYATMGELIAWMIGWDLILEFFVAAAAVAGGWSGYLQNVLQGTPLEIPTAVANTTEGFMNLPAGLLILALTAVLVLGIKLSSRINQVAVAIKVGVALMFVLVGIFFVKAANLSPFIPPAEPTPPSEATGLTQPLIQAVFGMEPGAFGWAGIFAGAAVVFFAFIGFDVLATTAEETRDPQRNMPIGIIGALAICTAMYVAVTLVLTGMQDYKQIDSNDPAPLATALTNIGQPGLAKILAIGAACGIIVVVMILLIGQTRVGFAMARDGLLPPALAKVHPKYRTPYVITIIVGIGAAILATFTSIGVLAELVNVGTLAAFILVSIGVIVLRRTRPDLPRSFRTPWVPVLPIVSALACFYLMLNLAIETWIRFLVWMAVGFVIYFLYGRRHSRLGQGQAPVSTPPAK
ncbi:amino acid permease [Tenggerimyces flavus]|uniref:Amino acid permease n=1 Tax=Tenggerimyces flavus TaxID=1708749 RepID=A0ABV7YP26_9ACTN|nr:amino acid permease [Tenggerimyces flavus]MBM7787748.1 APA family basic amino acid/polyamine antiporter [Tenggerimyces flavus]